MGECGDAHNKWMQKVRRSCQGNECFFTLREKLQSLGPETTKTVSKQLYEDLMIAVTAFGNDREIEKEKCELRRALFLAMRAEAPEARDRRSIETSCPEVPV